MVPVLTTQEHIHTAVCHDDLELRLCNLYDRHAPAIYGSVKRMGLTDLQAGETLCSTFLHLRDQLKLGLICREVPLVALIDTAWNYAQRHVKSPDEPLSSTDRQKVSFFLRQRGFTQDQIRIMLRPSTVT